MKLATRLSFLTALAAVAMHGASTARADASRAERKAFVKTLETNFGPPILLPDPAPPLNLKRVQQFDRTRPFGNARIPRIPAAVRNATREQIAKRRAFILTRYRQLSFQKANGTVFGGYIPRGGTAYIPLRAINIATYFPVFRVSGRG